MDNRAKSLKIDDGKRLKLDAIKLELFMCEHLFRYHVLLATTPHRNKLDPRFFCAKDLGRLIRRTVRRALENPKHCIKCHHEQPTVGPRLFYTMYRARFEKSVGSFQIVKQYTDGSTKTVKYHQFEVAVMYINLTLFNTYSCGPGFKEDKNYSRQDPRKGKDYPMGGQYR